MAGEIIDPKTMQAINKDAAQLSASIEAIKNNSAKINIKLFSEHLSKGKITLEEIKQIYKEVGNDANLVAQKLREIDEGQEAVKNTSKEWLNHVNGVSDKLLGITLPTSLTDGLRKAADITVEWYNHTASVNRELYDIGANLGEATKSAGDFEDKIRKTADSFNVTHDAVRATVNGMAAIGMHSGDISETMDDIHSMTAQWSEMTPEKQLSLMSDYMKQFGMNGKDAWSTMFNLVESSKALKDIMPNLDIKRFVDQTHDVAISMRQYGLETQDAIALTSTLARLGVEQARIPELAKTMGGIGLGSPETAAYMAQQQLMPRMREEHETLQNLGVRSTPAEQTRMEDLARRRGIAAEGAIGQIGVMVTATPAERMEAQMGHLEKMLGAAHVKMSDPVEKIVGALVGLDLPGIGKMGVQQAEELGGALRELTTKGVSSDKELKALAALGITDVEKGDVLNMKQAFAVQTKIAEQATKDAAEFSANQIKLSEVIADKTTTIADRLDVKFSNIGSMLRGAVFGESPGAIAPARGRATGIVGGIKNEENLANLALLLAETTEEPEFTLGGAFSEDINQDKLAQLATRLDIAPKEAKTMIGGGEIQKLIESRAEQLNISIELAEDAAGKLTAAIKRTSTSSTGAGM